MKTILVTGGAGFVGSNFVPYFMEKYPEYRVVNLDKLTYAGSLDNLEEVEDNKRHIFVKGDLKDRTLLETIFVTYNIVGVIHFAAESHIDNVISKPGRFIDTNIVGTYTLLDVARHYWMDSPFKVRKHLRGALSGSDPRFHQVSTYETYGSLGDRGLFTEASPYAPNSPYPASKAASDLLAQSYYHTYGLNVTRSNSSNNFGPKQYFEKFIPTIIREALKDQPIYIYGDGLNIRDWVYVMDHCKAVDRIFHSGVAGETYNIGGNSEQNNLFIAQYICSALDARVPKQYGRSYKDQIIFTDDKLGHDRRCAIDSSKMLTELNWKPEESFESGMIKCLEWILEQ